MDGCQGELRPRARELVGDGRARAVPAALVAALALASLGSSAAADDVAAIEARLRKLESENAALRRDLERLQQQPRRTHSSDFSGGATRAARTSSPRRFRLLDALSNRVIARDLGSLVVGVLTFLFFYHTGTNFLRWVVPPPCALVGLRARDRRRPLGVDGCQGEPARDASRVRVGDRTRRAGVVKIIEASKLDHLRGGAARPPGIDVAPNERSTRLVRALREFFVAPSMRRVKPAREAPPNGSQIRPARR